MTTQVPSKPYDIRARSFLFARDVLKGYPAPAQLDVPSSTVWRQLIRAATSVGANLEEAHAAGSRADFRFHIKVALREARETHYWLRLVRAADLLGGDRTLVLEAEANQLVAILTAIAKNSSGSTAPR